MDHPPACTAHRALVDEALGPDPSDEVLERYASEVPECPACRRLLAVRVGVHPGALGAPLDPLAGMPALLHAVRSDSPRRRPAVWAAAITVSALAAGLAWWMVRADVAEPEAISVAVASPTTEASAGPAEVAPEPRVVVESAAPVHAPPAGHPAPVAAPIEDDDGIAMVDPEDWPRPAFEDLRRGAAKGPAPTVRAAQLVLSGTAEVGRDMTLTVVTSGSTPIEVCVDGPERGVVWDGAVDAGRTELTRGGQPVAFAFAAPGQYRFSLATNADAASCAAPVHVVEVEVGG